MSVTTPEATVTAVVYAAKSTEDVRGSIPGQVEECRTAAEAEGRTVIDVFKDEAKSGYTGNRGPGLAAARAAAEEHGAELWVVHSDRLARGDGREAMHLVEHVLWAMKTGVTLRSVQDDDACRDLLYAAVNGTRNHEDSKRKSASVRSGKRRRFESGKAVGSPIPDGYRLVSEVVDGGVVQRRELDPARVPIIERIFAAVEGGATFGDVARQLNAEGLRTVPRKGYPQGTHWTNRRVRATVQNPYYCGDVRAYDERRRGDHPALIERDRWEAIQAQLTRLDPGAVQRRKGGRKPVEEYMLRGIAFCAVCDSAMYTRRQAAGRTYVCRNVREATGLCSAPPVLADALEAAVLAHLDRLMPGLDDWIGELAAERRGERAVLERAVEDLRARHAEAASFAKKARAVYAQMVREDGPTRIALEEADKADRERDELAVAIEGATARVEEFSVTPSKVDAALDFYSELAALVSGRIKASESATALRTALGDILNGCWVRVQDDGRVSAEFSVRTPDDGERPWRYVGMDLPQAVALTPPGWLKQATPEPGATDWCT